MACAHFALVYTWRSGNFLNIQQYAAGTGPLPYQARILMSWVYRALLPLPLLDKVGKLLPSALRSHADIVTLGVTLVSLLIAVLATRRSIHVLTGDRGFARWASLLVVWMTYFNLATSYGLTYRLPYDAPSLALFALGLMCVLLQWQWLLYPLMVIGTLNRETFLFVAVFFAVWEWVRLQELPANRRLIKILPFALLQVALWAAVKLWLKHHFAGAPIDAHDAFQIHLKPNIRAVLNPGQWPLLTSICGFSWIPILVWRRWIVHRGVYVTTLVMMSLWFLLMMVVGVIIEIRIFGELSALLALAVAVALHARWKKADIAA